MLFEQVRMANATLAEEVRTKIDSLSGPDELSIPDMFEMQMLMNKLTQMSELSLA